MQLNDLVVACALFFTVLASPALADQIAVVGTPDQLQQVQTSLEACPSLKTSLQQATVSGLFSDIRVVPRTEVGARGPFEAAIRGHEIILTAEWLAVQKVPYFDVRAEGEILPDNLCFGLGHLAEHIVNPMPGPKSSSDFTGWLHLKLASEARAFLVGWGYVREAALAKNNGVPLTGKQVGQLMINLRYRFAFVQAMAKTANPRLEIASDAFIPLTDNNVAAISTALEHSPIADLQ